MLDTQTMKPRLPRHRLRSHKNFDGISGCCLFFRPYGRVNPVGLWRPDSWVDQVLREVKWESEGYKTAISDEVIDN